MADDRTSITTKWTGDIALGTQRLTVELPYGSNAGDPNVACGAKRAKVRCSPAGALDLMRTIASALGREDIVRLCFPQREADAQA